MPAARDLIVGLDGPAVVVSGRVAHRIAPPLAGWVRKLADEGGTPDPEVVETVQALRLTASAYASQRVTALERSPGLHSDRDPRRSHHGWLTAPQVAEQLGCGKRNVHDLRARARLTAEFVSGRWLYCPVSVAEYAQERSAA